METTIKMKTLKGWEETTIPISLETLLKYRAICLKEFKIYLEREKDSFDQGFLGFVPLTFTGFWLEKNKVELPQGLSLMELLYASYQKIYVMDYTGIWKQLPMLYKFPKERG